MATIGNITVGVIANTQRAVANMRKFRTEVRATSVQARGSAGPVSQFGMVLRGLGTAAVIGGVLKASSAIKKMIVDIDKLSKMRDRLGFSAKALSGLQHVAELSGVSFDVVGMASQRMTRRIAEAAVGTGEAVNALKELNLSASRLRQLTPDEQLMRISDAMSGVANQGDRVRLAMKLFDTEGVKMLNVMKGGSVAIREAIREAERFAITMNDKVLDNFTKLGDELNKQGKMWLAPFRAMRNYIGENLLPAVNELLEGINIVGSNRLEGMSGAQLGAIAQRQNQQRDLFRREKVQDFGGPSATARFREAQAVKHSQESLAKEEADIARRKKEREKLNDQVTQAQIKTQKAWEETQRLAAKNEQDRKAAVRSLRQQFEQGFLLKEEVSKINALASTGSISQAVARAAIHAAKDRDSSSFGGSESRDRTNRLLERGSSEAFSALRANVRTKSDTLLEKQLEETRKQTSVLEKIAANEAPLEVFAP